MYLAWHCESHYLKPRYWASISNASLFQAGLFFLANLFKKAQCLEMLSRWVPGLLLYKVVYCSRSQKHSLCPGPSQPPWGGSGLVPQQESMKLTGVSLSTPAPHCCSSCGVCPCKVLGGWKIKMSCNTFLSGFPEFSLLLNIVVLILFADNKVK